MNEFQLCVVMRDYDMARCGILASLNVRRPDKKGVNGCIPNTIILYIILS